MRTESKAKELLGHVYWWDHPDVEAKSPTLTRQQWIQRLESRDPIEKLGALSWITGLHYPSSEPRWAVVRQESLENSKLFESVRDDPATRRILGNLSSDPNPWVRDYGELWEAPKSK